MQSSTTTHLRVRSLSVGEKNTSSSEKTSAWLLHLPNVVDSWARLRTNFLTLQLLLLHQPGSFLDFDLTWPGPAQHTQNKLSHLAAPSFPPAWQLPGFWLDQGQPNTHSSNYLTLQFLLLRQLWQCPGNWAPWILTWLAPASHRQTFSPCGSFSTSLEAPVLPIMHNYESVMHRFQFWCTD